MEAIKNKIENLGNFNAWRGFVGLYLTKKELRTLKPYRITEDTTLLNAYKK